MNDTLTIKQAYLIGAYLGDGSISFVPQHGNYFFALNAIDKEFVLKVADCLHEYFGKEPSVFLDKLGGGWQKRNTQPLWKTVVYGKSKCQYLRDITHDKRVIPQCIFTANKKIQKAFIAGVMDSEGYVGKHYNQKLDRTQYLMGIASTDVWLEDFIELLTKHGVKVGKRYKEKQIQPWHKPKFRYKINTMSWIKSGCYFTIDRKNQRLNDYLNRLSPQRLHV
jgi:intein-encoded DNA endonuclease-like protein